MRYFLTVILFAWWIQHGSFAQAPLIHYDFSQRGESVINISSDKYHAGLHNNAQVLSVDTFKMLSLGNENGYLDLGQETGEVISKLEDFTISANVFIDNNASITGNGNFLWVFSTSNSCGSTSGKYIAYRVNIQRYALSTGGYSNEKVAIQKGSAAVKGSWQHVVYRQANGVGTVLVNGEVAATGAAGLRPKDIGTSTTYNWIGRPHFSGDAYLKNTLISDFRLYDRALSNAEIATLGEIKDDLSLAYDVYLVEQAMASLSLGDMSQVTNDIKLPLYSGDIRITWLSSDVNYVSHTGKIISRPQPGAGNKNIKLTATLKRGSIELSKEFEVTLLEAFDDRTSVDADLNNIVLTNNLSCLRGNITLPKRGSEGSVFTWTSGNQNYLSDKGELLSFPATGEGSVSFDMVVTASKGNVAASRTFRVTIPEDEGYSAYLFAYFTGNTGVQESIRFALSHDGYTYQALKSNLPVISSDTISDTGGVRDPHILRGADGKSFYMVVTDMKSANGWNSNHGMVLLKSNDLINWTHSRIDMHTAFPQFNTVNRVWAPQTIYDRTAGKYMVYWSMRSGNDPDVIYYSYANEAFTALETEPQVLFLPEDRNACIDGDIIEKDGKFHLFYKTEGNGNGIRKAVSTKLTGGYVVEDERFLQSTTDAVEGACVFRLINSDKFVLMYDVYNSGKYEFTESTDLEYFTLASSPVSMNFAPRHGTVIPVTAQEAARLANQWATSGTDFTISSYQAKEVKKNNVVVNSSFEVYLPVSHKTNLKSFDPGIRTAMPGISVTPAGPQDFTQGEVSYTLSSNSLPRTRTYKIKATIDHNPVLNGYFADPEILYSQKTGKYYLYPTSDGYTGWSGYSFHVFSSDDLVEWEDEGTIVDLSTDDVVWASRNAWAPCIEEKKVNGEYKYYYYFTAAQQIGVAVADDPTGPFVDSGRPIIASGKRPAGATGGQEIDPDVFTDPVSGKSYLYWGNGYLAAAELEDSMVEIKEETMVNLTPSDGTFREGAYVIYRNGKYYFFWSENDTRSADYRVRYGIADNPLGPIQVPASNLILSREDNKGIYGTGHNSILQLPGKDEWYIVYHRFTRPKGISMGESAGYHREVCIDKLEFQEDGAVKVVVPTLEGVSLKTDPPTSLEQLQEASSDVSFYPNPIDNILNYRFNQPFEGEVTLRVTDLFGKQVVETNLLSSGGTINCSRMAPGCYVFTTLHNDKMYRNKMLKQ